MSDIGRYCCKRALKAGDQHDSVFLARFATGADMMGRRNQSQGQLFYEFRLDDAVPDDHLVRKISALLDLSWVYAELAPYYSEIGAATDSPSMPA